MVAACGSPASPDVVPDSPPPIPRPTRARTRPRSRSSTSSSSSRRTTPSTTTSASFPGAEGATAIQTSTGTVRRRARPTRRSRDLCHEHDCALTDWTGGEMNGWDGVAGITQRRQPRLRAVPRGGHPELLAVRAALRARRSVLRQRCSGRASPATCSSLAAQAGWAHNNPNTRTSSIPTGAAIRSVDTVDVEDQASCTDSSRCSPASRSRRVPDILPAGVDWKFYGSNFYVLPRDLVDVRRHRRIRNGAGLVERRQHDAVRPDVENGTLPAVSWLVDQDLDDEHPHVGGVCAGENWTVGHINHDDAEPYWQDTAILFTMDDFGGWYDHVAPPRQYGCDTEHALRPRLPPAAHRDLAVREAGHVFNEVAEQASIPKLHREASSARRRPARRSIRRRRTARRTICSAPSTSRRRRSRRCR